MPSINNKLNSGLKLSSVLLAAALATGCISAKSKPTEEAQAAAEAPAPAAPAPAAAVEPVSQELTSWTVAKGSNLWAISGTEEVYNVPEQWPLIYKSNLDQIKDADLIYPGQVLNIPRGMSQGEIDGAVKHAKTRGAWAVGPVEAIDVAYANSSS